MAKASNANPPKPTAKEKRDAKLAAANAAKGPEAPAINTGASAPTSELSPEVEALNKDSTIRPDKVRDAHGVIAGASRDGGTVIVACKLGVAYYDIQLNVMEEVYENTQTGPRLVKQWKRTGQVVRLRGTAYPRGTPPEGFPEKPVMIGGAALNYGISKNFWDQWLEQHELDPMVLNKMIFAHTDERSIKAMASELRGAQSGLEPVNPKFDKATGRPVDPRVPRSTRADVSNIETEENRATKMDRAISASGS